MKAARWTCFAVGLLAVAGCQQPVPVGSQGYQTIGVDPRRDTSAARRDNVDAIELIGKGKFADAEVLLKKALDADVTYGPAHNNLGKLYFRDDALYLAAWEFQYASKLMPDVPEPRNNLGLVLEKVGKLDEAVICYEDAVKLAADNVQFLGNDARARYCRGDRDDRLRTLLESLVMRDTRAEWAGWAKERLVLLGPGPTTRP